MMMIIIIVTSRPARERSTGPMEGARRLTHWRGANQEARRQTCLARRRRRRRSPINLKSIKPKDTRKGLAARLG